MPKPKSKHEAETAVSEETRRRILDGAARAFGKLGYAATRVEDILAAAEISRPTFYKAFASKGDVFDELSARHHRDIRERIMRSLNGALDPFEQLERVVDTYVRWRAELGRIGRVLDQEARLPGTRLARHRRETLDAMSAWSAERLRGAGRGEADPLLYQALIAAMESVGDALLSRSPVPRGTIDRAKRLALRIVAGTLAGPGDELPPIPPPPKDSPPR